MSVIAIVGSRRRRDRQSVIDFVNSLPAGTTVVSGGCPDSVDTWAAEAAKARGLKVIEHKPRPLGLSRLDYTKACHARNYMIAKDVADDRRGELHAWVAPDRRGGTENTIKHALRLGLAVGYEIFLH
jgi:hypothetical protein